MKKIIVLSDNHGETGILYDVYQQHKDAEAFFHLGDSEFKYDDTELSLFQRVKGNVDFYPEFPEQQVVTVGHVRIFLTHGHLYNVNSGRQQLAQAAIAHDAVIALYGHTHVAKYKQIHDVHVINPGSISQSRSDMEETYAEIVLDAANSRVNFRNRNHEIIDTVTFQIEV
ncbi:YfcE family phosphodiesterase [Staphylococcus intermedius]|uniref:Phosphoesterase n=1 Tax=Staphylococcus intermedius NCTC 11048 TaxID=1141106 RepID=A0A380G9U6_STAIN|nr:metallophosphoesterase [Staphylococcus intermedius]PCF65174.1 metal-dependent phosphodiesterase [Staphylococcus intermedius]PCF80784.1 metal-dependent phosphodiesterase [Staphylococcus intermedius]PCF82133.1 metal-dependent phosphodiesterase [Staphylococcus intermedius]PCF88469.1 metal-dependent phosphodiesterase [Staphylococcus intermedius]PCF89184.1 metal-dependent phosphodiesterase [Staphylococcus intermedius]